MASRSQALTPAKQKLSKIPSVLQLRHMSHTLTIRLTDELLAWLKEISRRTGLPVGRIVRQQLESARAEKGNQRFLRHAGLISGPADLSSGKGFSRR
jgi:predicted DNA binding CopG/RHH family protein